MKSDIFIRLTGGRVRVSWRDMRARAGGEEWAWKRGSLDEQKCADFVVYWVDETPTLTIFLLLVIIFEIFKLVFI